MTPISRYESVSTSRTRTPITKPTHPQRRLFPATEIKQRVAPAVRLARTVVRRSLGVQQQQRNKLIATPGSSKIPLPLKTINNQQQTPKIERITNENDNDDVMVQLPKKLLIQLLQTPSNIIDYNNFKVKQNTPCINNETKISPLKENILNSKQNEANANIDENDDLCKLSIKLETQSECLIVNKKIKMNELETIINNKNENKENSFNNNNKKISLKDKLVNDDALTPFAMRNLFKNQMKKTNKRSAALSPIKLFDNQTETIQVNHVACIHNETKSLQNTPLVIHEAKSINKRPQTRSTTKKRAKNNQVEYLSPKCLKNLFKQLKGTHNEVVSPNGMNLLFKELTPKKQFLSSDEDEPMDVDPYENDEDIIGPTQDNNEPEEVLQVKVNNIAGVSCTPSTMRNLFKNQQAKSKKSGQFTPETLNNLFKTHENIKTKETSEVITPYSMKNLFKKNESNKIKDVAEVTTPYSMKNLFKNKLIHKKSIQLTPQTISKLFYDNQESSKESSTSLSAETQAKRKSFICDNFYPKQTTSASASPICYAKQHESRLNTNASLLVTPYSMRNLFKNKNKRLTAADILSPVAIRTLFSDNENRLQNRRSQSANNTPYCLRNNDKYTYQDFVTPKAMKNLFKIKNQRQDCVTPKTMNSLFSLSSDIFPNDTQVTDQVSKSEILIDKRISEKFKIKELRVSVDRLAVPIVNNERVEVELGDNIENKESIKNDTCHVEMALTESQTQDEQQNDNVNEDIEEPITQIPNTKIERKSIENQQIFKQELNENDQTSTEDSNEPEEPIKKSTRSTRTKKQDEDAIKKTTSTKNTRGKKKDKMIEESKEVVEETVQPKDSKRETQSSQELNGSEEQPVKRSTRKRDLDKNDGLNHEKAEEEPLKEINDCEEQPVKRATRKRNQQKDDDQNQEKTEVKSTRSRKKVNTDVLEEGEEAEKAEPSKKSTRSTKSKKVIQQEETDSQKEPAKKSTRTTRGKKQESSEEAKIDLVEQKHEEEEANVRSTRTTKKKAQVVETQEEVEQKEPKKKSTRSTKKKADAIGEEIVQNELVIEDEPMKTTRTTRKAKQVVEVVENKVEEEQIKTKTRSTRKKTTDSDISEAASQAGTQSKSTRSKKTAASQVIDDVEEEKPARVTRKRKITDTQQSTQDDNSNDAITSSTTTRRPKTRSKK